MSPIRTGALTMIVGAMLIASLEAAVSLPGGTSTHDWNRNESRGSRGGGIRDWGRNETPAGRRDPNKEPDRRPQAPSGPAEVKQPSSEGAGSWGEPGAERVIGPQPSVGLPIGGVIQSLAVNFWHSNERAAQESLVNAKDGNSAFNGYTKDPSGEPTFTRLGFATARTKGVFITLGYIGGEKLGSYTVEKAIRSIKVLQGGSLLKRVSVEAGTEIASDYVGGISAGGGAVVGSFFHNLDVIDFNIHRAAEIIFLDSRFGQQPIPDFPFR